MLGAQKKKEFSLEENIRDKAALEKRYGSAYQSAVNASLTTDTKPLEQLIQRLQDQEYESSNFFETILYQAQKVLDHYGSTIKIIESASKRKLKAQNIILEKQLSDTTKQVYQIEQTIQEINEQLLKHSSLLSDQKNTISEKKKSISQLQQEIADYQEISQTSLHPHSQLYLAQGRLDLDVQEQELHHLQDISSATFSLIQEYYAQKSHEYALRSVFQSNAVLLDSLIQRVNIGMKKLQSPVVTVARNKAAIISTYSLQESDLEKQKNNRLLYNNLNDSLPSYANLAKQYTKKWRSLISLKL